MPFDPLSLILVNVGASVFNNWRNNKQSKRLQDKQQEFARAAAERNKERMWQLMREGQELALEMEKENHENRLEDIKNDFDKVLERLAFAKAIESWPLKVLPIVMKNMAIGNASIGESIPLHCILTPSNCPQFNKYVFPSIEAKLSDFFNLHWTSLSNHPIIFYSGAWKTGNAPTGVEVQQLKTNLSNLPTLLITPYFKTDGGLVFQITAWGVGNDLKVDVFPEEFSYAETYARGLNYKDEKDLLDRTIEEFVPYLQCLIGYLADQYFWVSHSAVPLLPALLAIGIVNVDGMRYLQTGSEERYNNLLDFCKKDSALMPFMSGKMLSLFEGSALLWDDMERKRRLEEIFIAYVKNRSENNVNSMHEAIVCGLFSKNDKSFIIRFMALYQYDDYKDELSELLELLDAIDFDYKILESTDIPYLEQLVNNGNAAAMYRLGEIYEYSINVKYDIGKSSSYYNLALSHDFLLAKIYLALQHDNTNNLITKKIYQGLEVLSLYDIEMANVRLSQLYYNGYWVNEDKEKAIELIESLEEIKNAYTLYWGAKMIIDLYGKEQAESIEKLLSTSADMGYIKSQSLLIDMYRVGYIVEKSPKLSAHYAQLAANQGSISAFTRLGIYYATGFGVTLSPSYAKELLQISANNNDKEAIEYLKHLK